MPYNSFLCAFNHKPIRALVARRCQAVEREKIIAKKKFKRYRSRKSEVFMS